MKSSWLSCYRGLPLQVGAFYALLIGILRRTIFQPTSTTTIITTLWMGFVLTISFMEAWVKFRAPFLPRHYALDVGRTVFPVLNAVEVALCGHLWWTVAKNSRSLIMATLILLSQVIYMTPQLVLLGKHVIVHAFASKEPSNWSPSQRDTFETLAADVKQTKRPSGKLHIVYVLQELVKVILLATIVRNFQTGL
ncbi:expressed unknown protein [Seminavis robusta]|uniref:Uncharacterized protein n=1 Tax=Seminavis robusta TaxID=568900 RepID=A0A9N8EBN5_9STRA|nr:expressed unknown protein [Seminavis robusta]|eukprot:Sro770_g199990.1 n/a (194) ;mRNA; f:26641-27222